MSDTNKIEQKKQGLAENAIQKKGVPTDGAKINHQVQDKKEIHQPRDNA